MEEKEEDLSKTPNFDTNERLTLVWRQWQIMKAELGVHFDMNMLKTGSLFPQKLGCVLYMSASCTSWDGMVTPHPLSFWFSLSLIQKCRLKKLSCLVYPLPHNKNITTCYVCPFWVLSQKVVWFTPPLLHAYLGLDLSCELTSSVCWVQSAGDVRRGERLIFYINVWFDDVTNGCVKFCCSLNSFEDDHTRRIQCLTHQLRGVKNPCRLSTNHSLWITQSLHHRSVRLSRRRNLRKQHASLLFFWDGVCIVGWNAWRCRHWFSQTFETLPPFQSKSKCQMRNICLVVTGTFSWTVAFFFSFSEQRRAFPTDPVVGRRDSSSRPVPQHPAFSQVSTTAAKHKRVCLFVQQQLRKRQLLIQSRPCSVNRREKNNFSENMAQFGECQILRQHQGTDEFSVFREQRRALAVCCLSPKFHLESEIVQNTRS